MVLKEKLQKYEPYHQAEIDKYEYRTGEVLQVKKYCLVIKKILIEQAKFTYSPLGKVFEEERKTIKDQREKVTEENEKQSVNFDALIKKYDYDTKKDNLSVLKQKGIFNKLVDERKDKITALAEKLTWMI